MHRLPKNNQHAGEFEKLQPRQQPVVTEFFHMFGYCLLGKKSLLLQIGYKKCFCERENTQIDFKGIQKLPFPF